jgi:hypothetical protein
VAALKRDVLLGVHRQRLGREDLEDCLSHATLELVVRARTRARALVRDEHVAHALQQRILSRIQPGSCIRRAGVTATGRMMVSGVGRERCRGRWRA